MKEEMLSCLSKADGAAEFFPIPDAIKVLREYSRKVFEGENKIEDMIFTARISHSLQDYRQSNNNTVL